MSSEQELIERVRRKLPSRAGGDLRLGIGDDAAVVRPGSRAEWVVTTDAFLENVHFLARVHPPEDAGYKALARAASDLAAMGARPRYFLMSLALPAARTGKWLDHFLDGMSRAARRFGLVLAGGDTTRDSRVTINFTLLGSIAPGRAVLRSGARPGDLICVSGTLGEAELGLRLIKLGLQGRQQWKHLLQKHFRPEPRLALGQYLSKNRLASAMIDLSDGLSTDLAHICGASRVGARVNLASIPMVGIPEKLRKLRLESLGSDPCVSGFCSATLQGGTVDPSTCPPEGGRYTKQTRVATLTFNAESLALHGGDDYELLFTVPRHLARRLPRSLAGVPITIIGEITRERLILVADPEGRTMPLRARGWDPFRTRR